MAGSLHRIAFKVNLFVFEADAAVGLISPRCDECASSRIAITPPHHVCLSAFLLPVHSPVIDCRTAGQLSECSTSVVKSSRMNELSCSLAD